MARDDSGERLLGRLVFMSLLDGLRPSGIPQWLSPVAPVVTQAAVGAGHWAPGPPRLSSGRRGGGALGRRPPAAGRGRVGKRGWLRAGGVGPWHRSADPGRVATVHRAAKGPVAQAWPAGADYRRPDRNIRGPEAIAERPERP